MAVAEIGASPAAKNASVSFQAATRFVERYAESAALVGMIPAAREKPMLKPPAPNDDAESMTFVLPNQ